MGNVASAATQSASALQAAAANAANEAEANNARAFSREYIHPGYYAQRLRRRADAVQKADIYAQLTGFLAQPVVYDDTVIRATEVSAMSSGSPYNINRTPPQLGNLGSNVPFIARDLYGRINELLDYYLLDVPARTIDNESVLFEMLRQGLHTYLELLRSVAIEAKSALNPTRRSLQEYTKRLQAVAKPDVTKLEKRLTDLDKEMKNIEKRSRRNGLTTADKAKLQTLRASRVATGKALQNARSAAKEAGAVFARGTKGNTSSVRGANGFFSRPGAPLGMKQLLQLQDVRNAMPFIKNIVSKDVQSRVALRFVQTQSRQRRSAVYKNGKLKRWACPTEKADKAFLANGTIRCVSARLHSVITDEYESAVRDTKKVNVGSKFKGALARAGAARLRNAAAASAVETNAKKAKEAIRGAIKAMGDLDAIDTVDTDPSGFGKQLANFVKLPKDALNNRLGYFFNQLGTTPALQKIEAVTRIKDDVKLLAERVANATDAQYREFVRKEVLQQLRILIGKLLEADLAQLRGVGAGALAAGGLTSGLRTKQVAMRTVFGDRLIKRNLVLHSFLDTLSDALLFINPRVRMNPTARIEQELSLNRHPFHKRFEDAGGTWRRSTVQFAPRDMKYTEPSVEELAWDPEAGSFGTSGPQPYYLQLVRELYDAQRVQNVLSKVRLSAAGPRGVVSNLNLQDISDPAWSRYKDKHLRLINDPSSHMRDNLGVTSYGYVVKVSNPEAPWIRSYHRFGRDWYVDDALEMHPQQLPFGAYRDDFFDESTPQSGPRDALLDVFLNQLVTHLANTRVGCRYDHVATAGIRELPPAELYSRLARVRGESGFQTVVAQGVNLQTAYPEEGGVSAEFTRAGPTLMWELLNGSGLIYGTRHKDYFGGVSKFSALGFSSPAGYGRRSASLLEADLAAKTREVGNKANAIAANEKARQEKKDVNTKKADRDTAVTAKSVKNLVDMYMASGVKGKAAIGSVNQSVITFPLSGKASMLPNMALGNIMANSRTPTGMWYPSSELAAKRRALVESGGKITVTGHDVGPDFLRSIGFGLHRGKVAQRNNNAQRNNAPQNKSASSRGVQANTVRTNAGLLQQHIVMVDGEIHSLAQFNERVPVRFAGTEKVLSHSDKNIPRRQPLVTHSIPGQDPSREARANAHGMAELLQQDAESGYYGLRQRLHENLITPLFEGKMILKYYHFHDLLRRFMKRTKSRPVNSWQNVQDLYDKATTADMMDCLYFYILCYTGMSDAQAAEKLKMVRAMRQTQEGREMLLNTIKDLRLLGQDGIMSKQLFTRIARHLLAAETNAERRKLTRSNVNREINAIAANIQKTKKSPLRRVLRTVTGATRSTMRAAGVPNRFLLPTAYQNFNGNLGMSNALTTGDFVDRRRRRLVNMAANSTRGAVRSGLRAARAPRRVTPSPARMNVTKPRA